MYLCGLKNGLICDFNIKFIFLVLLKNQKFWQHQAHPTYGNNRLEWTSPCPLVMAGFLYSAPVPTTPCLLPGLLHQFTWPALSWNHHLSFNPLWSNTLILRPKEEKGFAQGCTWLMAESEATPLSQTPGLLHRSSKPSAGRMEPVLTEVSPWTGKRSQENTKVKLPSVHTVLPQAGSACNNIFTASSGKINLFKIATDFALGENVWQMQKREHCVYVFLKLFLTYEQVEFFLTHTKKSPKGIFLGEKLI